MGTTAATGSPLRMMTVGLPFCARVITAAKWARTSRTFILLSSSVMILMYPDLCTCRVPQASTTRLPSSVIARASLALAPSIASPTSPRRGGCPGLATPTPLCSRLRSDSTSVEKSARGACLVLRCEAGEGFACGGHYLLADPRTDDRGKGGAAGRQTWLKRMRRPERRSTRMNHRADKMVPATTPPVVTAVVSRRNTVAGSMATPAASPAADTANIPAHNQVAPWKDRSSPG